ncbi:hypothetical protein PLICRDRAFT_39691 [Plicaturopsis crispa FD-325 SS-3]|nr:hypothetical protein PLICRDRAFT_39691 [Plicaturopsis crispa FD-325 SS-3]
MSFVNLYEPVPIGPPRTSDAPDYGPHPYDINYGFPLPLHHLESSRVRLTPFVPTEHAPLYKAAVQGIESDLYRYTPFGPINVTGLTNFLHVVEHVYRRDPNFILFAVIDKASPDTNNPELGGSLAGVFGIARSSAPHLFTEISPAIVFPPFRGTGISKHATALLLRYALELPSASGLGMRRVQWVAGPKNIPSLKLAERTGFKYEGTTRWNRVLSGVDERDGMDPRKDDPVQVKGRDTVQLGLCWDDWEGGVRESVRALLAV